MKEIYLAGGCFWGVQKYFDLIDGVVSTQTCYINGTKTNPKYRDVCKGSGHAEAVHVIYNPSIISLEKLLNYYYDIINPTSYHKQGNDEGVQYRTGIYYKDKNDVETIINSLDELQKMYLNPIVIEVEEVKNVTQAEEYHQNFLKKNPFGYCHIKQELFDKVSKDSHNLSDLAYKVIKGQATEPAFDNEYWNNYAPGIYVDIKTGTPLFSSKDKFDAGCGWPSFSKTIKNDVVDKKMDFKHFMFRTEVKSKESGNHLGHLFNDGPKELGGKRYCINSAALRFIPKEKMEIEGYGDYLNLL